MLKELGVGLIAFTGDLDSPMAEQCDLVIDVGVEREACPMGLAPTASTTAVLAMGDALAVALVGSRRFDRKDFRRFHPGGDLGARLSANIKELMRTHDRIPVTRVGSHIREAAEEIDRKKIGATLVVDEDERLVGMLTDGDLRRALLREPDISGMKVEDIMSLSPITIPPDRTAKDALALMEQHSITHLVIVDRENRIQGIIHLYDLLGRKDFNINDH
jgi:arabinose-5-phosphate isomerase